MYLKCITGPECDFERFIGLLVDFDLVTVGGQWRTIAGRYCCLYVRIEPILVKDFVCGTTVGLQLTGQPLIGNWDELGLKEVFDGSQSDQIG